MEKDAEHIATLLRMGIPDAFRTAAAELGPRIYALAFEITNSRAAAEEISSDVLLKVFRSVESYDPGKGTFLGWVMRITRNTAISSLRRKSPDLIHQEIPETIPTPEKEESDQSELIREAISRCSPPERQAETKISSRSPISLQLLPKLKLTGERNRVGAVDISLLSLRPPAFVPLQ